MQKKKILIAFDILLMLIIFFFSSLLFYQYINGTYPSDFQAHINGAMEGKSYSVMGVLIYVVNILFHTKIALPVLMSLFVGGTILLTAIFIKQILAELGIEKVEMWYVIPIAAGSIFLCSLFIPKLWMFYYTSRTHITQPWHNSTYLLVRLLAVAVLCVYFKIEKEYTYRVSNKDLTVFTILLVLANASKPNFVLAFAPMMLVFLIIDFIKTKGKSFVNAFKFGMCVLISLVVLIVQAKILYVDSTDSGISLTLDKFYNQFMNMDVFVMIFSNLAFPILVTATMLLCKQKEKSSLRVLLQAWSMYFFSRLQGVFLTETGGRAADGNFSWGGYLFGYILYVICISEWIAAKKNKIINSKPLYYGGLVIYGLNILTGIMYFIYLCKGYYYIF